MFWKTNHLRKYFLLLSFLALCIQCSFSSINVNPKIIIVGAGSSGIASATKLLEYGFNDVTVLEAEPRIGGRVNTISFGDNVVDLGAQWCHGEKNNVVYETVKDLDLLSPSGDPLENITLSRSNGEIIPTEIAERLSHIIKDIRENHLEEAINFNGSQHDFLKEIYNRILQQPENKDIDPQIAQEFLENHEKTQIPLTSSDSLENIPAHGSPDFEMSEGEFLLNWKDKGYKQFLRILMKSDKLGKENGLLNDHIKLSKRVKRIDWKRNDSKVLVECEDGEEFLADHVIVTVSLGVLKNEHEKLFEPSLPTEKQKAIEGISFGAMNKIYAEFAEPFWPEDWTGFLMLWREDDLKELRGTKHEWYENVFGFLKVHFQPKVFEAFLVGKNGRQIENVSDDEVKDACVYMFKKFLPFNVSEPVKVVHTAWSTNPNFRGAYSYHSMEMETKGVKRSQLESPLFSDEMQCDRDKVKCEKPIVQFAGEATSTNHHSTVHGATETGWREAERLADFYEMKKK